MVLMVSQKYIVNIDHHRSPASIFAQSLSALSFRSPVPTLFRFSTPVGLRLMTEGQCRIVLNFYRERWSEINLTVVEDRQLYV
jgi:hypothetical protein